MAREDTINKDAWRVLMRRSGKVTRQIGGYGLVIGGMPSFLEYCEAAREFSDSNVELQERPAGKSRYTPCLQAIGTRLVSWDSRFQVG